MLRGARRQRVRSHRVSCAVMEIALSSLSGHRHVDDNYCAGALCVYWLIARVIHCLLADLQSSGFMMPVWHYDLARSLVSSASHQLNLAKSP